MGGRKGIIELTFWSHLCLTYSLTINVCLSVLGHEEKSSECCHPGERRSFECFLLLQSHCLPLHTSDQSDSLFTGSH